MFRGLAIRKRSRAQKENEVDMDFLPSPSKKLKLAANDHDNGNFVLVSETDYDSVPAATAKIEGITIGEILDEATRLEEEAVAIGKRMQVIFQRQDELSVAAHAHHTATIKRVEGEERDARQLKRDVQTALREEKALKEGLKKHLGSKYAAFMASLVLDDTKRRPTAPLNIKSLKRAITGPVQLSGHVRGGG